MRYKGAISTKHKLKYVPFLQRHSFEITGAAKGVCTVRKVRAYAKVVLTLRHEASIHRFDAHLDTPRFLPWRFAERPGVRGASYGRHPKTFTKRTSGDLPLLLRFRMPADRSDAACAVAGVKPSQSGHLGCPSARLLCAQKR